MAIGTGWNAFNTMSVIMTMLLRFLQKCKRYKRGGKLLKYNELYHTIVEFVSMSISQKSGWEGTV